MADKIVSQIRRDIFTGVYKPGQRLPIEQKLADEFGTSKGTLRRAIQTLNQEGWIETVQGRGNTVCDFRHTVSIDVVPELLIDCPEAVLNPKFLYFLADLMTFIFEQILLAASDNAKPEDEPRLLKLMHTQNEHLTLTELYDNEARFYGEILRIGDNFLLQMSYNLLIKIITGLVESRRIKSFSYPIPLYQKINSSLIKAVCSGDREQIKTLMQDYKKYMLETLQRYMSEISDSSSLRRG
jgi:DNA-binding FadR family transcriptional regulator